jgi:diguanylate cyclase (GGDEF)-like protein/hemerythrin-like metal-binding protein
MKFPNVIEVFPWNDNFETGITEIDTQHKQLVSLLNKLASTLVDDDNIEISKVFDELTQYAQYHFRTEEQIWGEYFGQDSWLTSHQQSHVDFLPSVIEIEESDTNMPLRHAVERVVKFLIRWLAMHIIASDRRMAFVVTGMDNGLSKSEAKVIADEKMSGSFSILIDTIMDMYDGLSLRTLELMRERLHRQAVEIKLREANQQLEVLATTDVLTGLHNRRYFNDVFAQELRRAKRNATSLALIIIDLDYFKKLNDDHGHSQGDFALAAVGACINELCRRAGDFGFRFGGEEFCILVTGKEAIKQIHEFSERLRKSVINLQISNSSSDAHHFLTVSIGATLVSPVNDQSAESIINYADKNLYEAKRLGRNRCVITPWRETA